MLILIFGATGLLGKALYAETSLRGFKVVGVARKGAEETLDITDDRAIRQLIKDVAPNVVINAAALTDICVCEQDPVSAYRVNARAPAIIADVCRANGVRFIHVSTDHYFVGDGDMQHSEEAEVHLVNEYAKTKYAAEAYVLTAPEASVLRTNISGFRGREGCPTIVEWLVECLNSKMPIPGFTDAFVSTIDVISFSKALFDLNDRKCSGLYNLACRETFSKYRFIKNLSAAFGFDDAEIVQTSVSKLGTARADSLGLNVGKAEHALGYKLPCMDEVIDNISTEYKKYYIPNEYKKYCEIR